jgi:BASS family bile acid:Na+ symporter
LFSMAISDRLRGLLGNNSFIFLLGLAIALTFNGGAPYTERALIPVLAVIMAVSILDISSRVFLDFRRVLPPVAVALVLSFVVLGGIYIGLSHAILSDIDLRAGFVIVAAVPPAVAVIPLTYLLGGDTRFSLVGNVSAYVAALAITPAICLLLLGASLIEPTRLLVILGELIVAPIVASRILRRTRLVSNVDRWRPYVVNWGFFLVIYTIVGLNRDTFLQEPQTLLLPFAIAFTGVVVLSEVINRAARLFGVDKATRISLIFLGTRKNDGVAGTIALIFFGATAAVPAALVSAISVIHFIWLTWWVKRMR